MLIQQILIKGEENEYHSKNEKGAKENEVG